MKEDLPKNLYIPEGPENGDDFLVAKWGPGCTTVSPNSRRAGWETDSECSGHGLPADVAKEICQRWNAHAGVIELLEKIWNHGCEADCVCENSTCTHCEVEGKLAWLMK